MTRRWYRELLLEDAVNARLTYATCEHPVTPGDDVLAVYPEGDCDAGTVAAVKPDVDVNGGADVKLPNGTTRTFLVEDVVHMCEETEA